MKEARSTQALWVITFKDNKPEPIKETKQKRRFPRIDTFLPDLSQQNSPPADPLFGANLESQRKALEFLTEIVEACKELKGECTETLEHKKDEDYEAKVSGVAENLKSLFKLIIEFTKLIKKNKPSDDKKP